MSSPRPGVSRSVCGCILHDGRLKAGSQMNCRRHLYKFCATAKKDAVLSILDLKSIR